MNRRPKIFIAFMLTTVWLTSYAAAQSGNGALKVTSFPTGANVSVDGVDTGKLTPMSFSLAVGQHSVVVSIAGGGWNADTRIVAIDSGNNDLSVTLLPALTTGPQGPVGPAGPQGAKGDTGSPGAAGANGINGTSIRVSASAPTTIECPPGGVAYEIVDANGKVIGGSRTVVCNGATGAQGSTGTPGATGASGPAGPPGPAGATPAAPPPAYGGTFLIQINDLSGNQGPVLPLASFAGCYDKILGVEYEDCYFQINGLSPTIMQWLNDTVTSNNPYRIVEVSQLNFSQVEVAHLEIANAFLSDFRVSDSDSASNSPGAVSLIVVPAQLTMSSGSGMSLSVTSPSAWLAHNFALQIDSVDTSRVSTVTGIHASIPKVAVAGGTRHLFSPGTPQFGDINIGVVASRDADFVSWANNIAQGQVDARNGSLQLLANSSGVLTVVGTLEFVGLVPVTILPFGISTSGATTVADLRVGSFRSQ